MSTCTQFLETKLEPNRGPQHHLGEVYSESISSTFNRSLVSDPQIHMGSPTPSVPR